jgi:hypothetical protein
VEIEEMRDLESCGVVLFGKFKQIVESEAHLFVERYEKAAARLKRGVR